MPSVLLSLDQAAQRLGISRRRAEALVLSGQLPAERLGWQCVVSPEAVRRATVVRGPGGRPVRPEKAWALIETMSGGVVGGRSELDALRRKVRPRAHHLDVYVHPGTMTPLLDQGVLGGRYAAAAAGAPVDVGDMHDIYLRRSEARELLERAGGTPAPDGANLYLHVVDDGAWPFQDGCQSASPWVAWLDLADRDDRAADTVLDRLIGGRFDA